MFKTKRWKEKRNKIKSAFKSQFHATQIEGIANSQAEMKLLSSRSFPLHVDSLRTSYSFSAESAPSSVANSGKYTPIVNGISLKSSLTDCMCFLSPLPNGVSSPTELMNWSINSAPDVGAYANNARRLRDSDDYVEKLRNEIIFLSRKLEVSDLELQTLRKKVVKGSRRGEDLEKEISLLREERDKLKRKCEGFEHSQLVINSSNASSSTSFHIAEDGIFSELEEIRQKLNCENDTNENLRLQVQQMQETNSQFIYAIRDLERLLKQRKGELACTKCGQFATDEDFQELEFENEIMSLKKSEFDGVLLDSISETESEEQFAIVAAINEHDEFSTDHLLEEKIITLGDELKLLKKEKEDMEKHMEQLALDNEILKQENHEISCELEHKLLDEQLKIQIINGLQIQVESLENELRRRSETFETDIATILRDKVEQEKRALMAEEEITKLRISNADSATLLQEEVKKISAEMSSTFICSERLLKQAQKEASELSLQKRQLEEQLAKSNESLAFLQDQYHGKLQQMLGLIDHESKETDRLILRLKDKHQELENYRISREGILNSSFEEIQSLKIEIQVLKAEKELLSQKLRVKEEIVD